jgi:hypothetical protein
MGNGKWEMEYITIPIIFNHKLCKTPNVKGEPIISVMAAAWFCEKSG